MSDLHKFFKDMYTSKLQSEGINFEIPEDYKLYQNCRKEVKKRMLINIIKLDIQNGHDMQKLKEIQDKTIELNKEIKAEKRNDKYIFLTINPPPNTKLSEMKKCIEKAIKRPFVKKYHYVFEQRGIGVKDAGKGKHIHFLFERNVNYKPSKIEKLLKSTFKRLFAKKTMNSNNFNFKKCGKEFYLARLKYIKGNKTEDGKDKKCKVDFVWRKLNKLKNIYEN